MSFIKVEYKVVSTRFFIKKLLKELESYKVLSFDTETQGVYSKEDKAEAKAYLKQNNLPVDTKRIALQVAENSGLSFPSLIRVTHFVFGVSAFKSVILICEDPKLELEIWNWVANYNGKLLVHNSLYDLKIMYHRIRKFPKDFEDTQLLYKSFVNNVDVWKAKAGLKDIMGSDYDPTWQLMDDYEPDNLKEPKFLQYASIDGAATFKLWFDMQEYIEEVKNG